MLYQYLMFQLNLKRHYSNQMMLKEQKNRLTILYLMMMSLIKLITFIKSHLILGLSYLESPEISGSSHIFKDSL